MREELTSAANGTYQYRSSDGGITWADEGKINNDSPLLMGGQAVNVGSVIHATFWIDSGANLIAPFKTTLHKSADNGATWTWVSDVTSTADGTDESGLIWLGGTTLLVAIRESAATKTYFRTSSDLGLTWGPLTDKTANFGVLQRPKFRYVGSRLYLFARSYKVGGSDLVIFASDDNGTSWGAGYKFNGMAISDCGYGDVLERANNDLYMVWYEGDSPYDTAIYAYVMGVGT